MSDRRELSARLTAMSTDHLITYYMDDEDIEAINAGAAALTEPTPAAIKAETLREVANECAVELDDPRIDYVTVQMSRLTWEALAALRGDQP